MPKFVLPKFNYKTLGLIAFALLVLVGLPITLYEVGQQQNIYQHAAWSVNKTQHYFCNSNLSVDLIIGRETPSCSTGTNSTATSYSSSMLIKASSGSHGNYTVHWLWAQFWCQNIATSPCGQNGSVTSGTGSLNGDGTVYTTAKSTAKK